MTIVEFLNARITEDEVAATLRESHKTDCETIPNWAGYSYPCRCGVPERMAAECTAKRAIVAEGSDEVIKHLAAIYSDHPDYQRVWGNDGSVPEAPAHVWEEPLAGPGVTKIL
jgi:hypothetical protein